MKNSSLLISAKIIMMVILIGFWIEESEGVRPQLVNSSIAFRENVVLGSSFSYATVDLQFDQDLYIPDMMLASTCTFGCCGSNNGESSRLQEWCNPSLPFTALPLNQVSSVISVENGETSYFRFYLPPSTWCSLIRVEVRLHSGQLDSFLSSTQPYPDITDCDLSRVTRYGRNQQSLTMVPWFDSTIGIGTVALALFGRTRAQFTVEVIVSEQKIPFTAPADPQACTNIPASLSPTDDTQGATNLVCLQDSQTVVFPTAPAGTEYQLVFSLPPGCHTYGLLAYPINTTTVGTDVDLYCIPVQSNVTITYANAIFASYSSSEDYLVFSTCSDERVWIRCGGDLWSSGPVAYLFSSVAPTIMKAVTEFNAYDYSTFGARNAVALATPGLFAFSVIQCGDWNGAGCNFFWPTFPTADPRTFWPPPDGIIANPQYDNMIPFDDSLLPSMLEPLPGRFVMTIVLESFSADIAASPDQLLSTPNVVLLAANLVNRDGEVVEFFPSNSSSLFRAPPSPEISTRAFNSVDIVTPVFASFPLSGIPILGPQCVSSSFNQVVNATEPLIEALSTTSQVYVTRFQIDTFTATEAYSACFRSVTGLLSVNQTNITTFTQQCLIDPNTPEFNNDPCCNNNLVAVACCADQPVQTTVISYYDDPNSALVTAQCQSPACTHSFLNSLAQVLNQQQDPVTACEVEFSSLQQLIDQNKALLPLAICREESGYGADFDGVVCSTDADCRSWVGAVCNQKLQRCTNISLATMEQLYLQCYIDNLDGFQIQWLKDNVLPANASDLSASSPEFFTLLRAAATVPDCLGFSVFEMAPRSHWDYSIADVVCGQSVMQAEFGNNWTPADYERFCSPRICLGLSCSLRPSNCLVFCHPSYSFVQAEQTSCENAATSFCRFPSCNGASVCAYCPSEDPSSCVTISTATSASECDAAIVCELPDGSYRTDLTADQCQAVGSCSTDCLGSSCRSASSLAGACLVTSATTLVACQSASSTFVSDYWFDSTSGTCVLTNLTSAFECSAIAAPTTWNSCKTQSICDRSSAVRQYLECFNDIFRDCTSASECQGAGRCSDLDVIPRLIDSSSHVAVYGGCFSSGFYSTDYVSQNGQDPICGRAEIPVRNACLAPSFAISSAAQCSPSNPFYPAISTPVATVWLTPALDEVACTSPLGCFEVTQFFDRVSWRNSSECLECNGLPERFWQWQSGTWKTGAVRQPQWQPAVSSSTTSWSTGTLSFSLTEQWILDALNEAVSLELRSAALCKFELITSPLSSLVCNCFGDDSTDRSTCYLNAPSAIPEALGKACQGVQSTIGFGLSYIDIDDDAVAQGCVALEVSKIDQSRFTSTGPPPSVSFRLAVPESAADSPVKNAQDKVVGELMGNGIKLDVSSANQLRRAFVCLEVNSDHNTNAGEFPVIDFGTSTASLSKIVPLGLANVSLVTNGQNLVLYCALMETSEHINASTSFFFPIRRIRDYQSGSGSSYSTTSIALVYTLGALYCICLLFITIFTVVATWWWWTTKKARSLMPFAGLFFMFLCIFRLIYCFMVPSDVITDEVANYAVFELPTFFYFTSFSIILAIWFEALVARDMQAKVRWSVIIFVNTLGYLLFISVMIAVAVISGQESETQSECPGRVASTPSSKATETRNLSLAYQSIVIAITFGLSLAFLYSVVTMTKRSRKLGRTWSEVYAKSKSILNIAIVVVVGFLTRCILFIIILALDFTSTIYMFIALTITEIIVILLVCSQFSVIKEAGRSFYRMTTSRSTTSRSHSPTSQSSHPRTTMASRSRSSAPESRDSA